MEKRNDKITFKVEADIDEALQKVKTLKNLIESLKELGISNRNINRIMKHMNIKEV